MPKNTIYVGRPTKWGNPYYVTKHLFKVGSYNVFERSGSGKVLIAWGIPKEMALELALVKYEQWLDANINCRKLKIEELRGKNLACFCPPSSPCHVDILFKKIAKMK